MLFERTMLLAVTITRDTAGFITIYRVGISNEIGKIFIVPVSEITANGLSETFGLSINDVGLKVSGPVTHNGLPPEIEAAVKALVESLNKKFGK